MWFSWFLFKLWLPGISESFGLLSYFTAALHKSYEEPERESSLDLYFYSKFFRGKLCSPPPLRLLVELKKWLYLVCDCKHTVGKFTFMIDKWLFSRLRWVNSRFSHVGFFFFSLLSQSRRWKSFVADLGKLRKHTKCLKQFMGVKLSIVCMSSNGLRDTKEGYMDPNSKPREICGPWK
jgi:hypothetical protein